MTVGCDAYRTPRPMPMVKVAIKREQSETCFNYAERERVRLKHQRLGEGQLSLLQPTVMARSLLR